MIGSHSRETVLFNWDNLESISQRWCTYIVQRGMNVELAWQQAIADEADLVEAKLELMQEGALTWDWQAQQLDAMRSELQRRAEQHQWQAVDGEPALEPSPK